MFGEIFLLGPEEVHALITGKMAGIGISWEELRAGAENTPV